MAYPEYKITFNSDHQSARVTSLEGKEAPFGTDGSHTFVLDVNGTQLQVDLTHESIDDRTPKLILTFK
jgi:hypothetical protein